MMLLAGHCPTKSFSLEHWQSMPVFVRDGQGYPPPEGYSRSSDARGKPVVIWFDMNHWRGSVAVRPKVRVPMRRG